MKTASAALIALLDTGSFVMADLYTITPVQSGSPIRVTTADVALRDRKQAFHIGDTPPVVKRRIVESAPSDDPH